MLWREKPGVGGRGMLTLDSRQFETKRSRKVSFRGPKRSEKVLHDVIWRKTVPSTGTATAKP